MKWKFLKSALHNWIIQKAFILQAFMAVQYIYFYIKRLMKYITMINKFEKTHTCPFCHEKPENMLQIGKYFFVIPARAPYSKDHLLIVPKRHVNMMITLSHEELKEMYKLVDIRAKKLHTKHKDVNLLLRDGVVKDINSNKSVNHLHFHLLADIQIHINQNADDRTWLEDVVYTKLAQTLKKKFL